MQLEPIGSISASRSEPRNTIGWGDAIARIDLIAEMGTHALDGLDGFSHVEIVFWFDQVTRRSSYAEPSRARGRDDMPLIGVFAARGPNRPNPIGVSACPIVELGETWLKVRGLDAVDGTPVLDIKPVMAVLVPRETQEPEWSSRLMADYYTG